MMSRERTSSLVDQLEEALDSITALTAASLTSLELPELLDRSLERLITVVKTKVAIIFLLSESGTELEAVAARAASRAWRRPRSESTSPTMTGSSVAS